MFEVEAVTHNFILYCSLHMRILLLVESFDLRPSNLYFPVGAIRDTRNLLEEVEGTFLFSRRM
jgi:hypothetical protein